MSECYFCDETERLEEHHIVPRRFGGCDTSKNLVEVCPTCHSKLEHLYGSRFYKRLGVKREGATNKETLELVKGAIDKYEQVVKRDEKSTINAWIDTYDWVNEEFTSELVLCVGCGHIVEPEDNKCPLCNTPTHD